MTLSVMQIRVGGHSKIEYVLNEFNPNLLAEASRADSAVITEPQLKDTAR
jgi:hypothetical protein